jgi:type VI secretion system secreted protein Hcp
VTVLKNIDKSSPQLIEHVATGKHIAKGVLSFRTASEKGAGVYYTVTLTDVLVSSIDQTDNPDPGKIVEKLSLAAAKFSFEYRPQNADGSLGSPVDFGFDCRTNTKF